VTDLVTVKVAVNYRAWVTPDEAVIDMPARPNQDGVQPLPKVAVEELEPAALDALAKQWLDHLYAKCGRGSPFRLIGVGQ